MVDQAPKVPSGSGKNLAGPCLETMTATFYQQHLHLAYQNHLDRAQLQYNVGLKSADEGGEIGRAEIGSFPPLPPTSHTSERHVQRKDQTLGL